MASAHQAEAAANKTAERSRPEKPEAAPQRDLGLEGIALRWVAPGQQYAPPPDAGFRQRSLLALQRTVGNRRATATLVRSAAPLLRDSSPAEAPPSAADLNQTDEKARTGLVAALGETGLGRKAGAIFNQYGVGIHWTDSGTAGFEDRTNVVHLNRKMRSYELAAYFIHEMHHAQQFNSGKSKGPETYGDAEKAKYVKTMVAEEIEATFRQFESIYEAGGGSLPYAGTRADLVPTYIRVRKDWIGRHLKDHPGDDEGAEKTSVSKCRQLIRIWFDRPTPSMSAPIQPNQFQTYQEYYEGMFDSAQKAKAATPAYSAGGSETGPTAAAEPLEHEESKEQFPALA